MGIQIIRIKSKISVEQAKKIGLSALFALTAGELVSCTQLSTLSSTLNLASIPTPTSSSTAVLNAALGPKAAKIFFSSQSVQSSFDPIGVATSSSGTSQQQTTSTNFHPGLQPIKVFNPDGSLLGSRTYNTDGTVSSSNQWPSWISSIDIGISGPNNLAATNSACAQFATASEANPSNTSCLTGPVTNRTQVACGAPAGQFRVSEADCVSATTGTGGPNDGVYLRAVFNRGQVGLAMSENILVVIEYLASSLNPAPQNPRNCFINGIFYPEGCSDFTWKAFLKHNITENSSSTGITIQPFLMLIPPMTNSVLGSANQSLNYSGANPMTRQIIVPLAADSNLSVLQISRIQNNFPSQADLATYCGASASGSNSPLCAGVIFYSMTFYRI
jgi:hypothetical protein